MVFGDLWELSDWLMVQVRHYLAEEVKHTKFKRLYDPKRIPFLNHHRKVTCIYSWRRKISLGCWIGDKSRMQDRSLRFSWRRRVGRTSTKI